MALSTPCALAQAATGQPIINGQQAIQSAAGQSQQSAGQTTGLGSKDASGKQKSPQGSDPTSQSKSADAGQGAGEDAASAQKLRLGPLDPSTAPTDLPKGRPVVGLALGGGAAIAMSEIGTLEWMEEHHIPVDVIAGTSMGSILAALYSTGVTPKEMRNVLTANNVNQIFRISSDYAALSYRRREDEREIPNAIGVGLKKGVHLRNSLLTDTGLNELLDKEFLRYNDQTDFNNLPIPFRCQATDLNDAKTVTFARGSLQDAVRASASIPGVFRPFEMNGHEFVDGAILENLPTADVKAMKADVIIAVSLPLEPVGKGDLDSILGVLQRAFAVGIENNEARDRKLANVVIMPEVKGFSANDYLQTEKLAALGYAAAEAHKAELMQYAISEDQWRDYMAHRRSKERPEPSVVEMVKVKAPNPGVEEFVNRSLKPMVNQPLDTNKVEAILADVRADGRYEADYTVGYDGPVSNKPIVLVNVRDKKTGPPFLDLGLNIQAQTGGVTRATLSTIVQYQDLGGYGSGFRSHIDVGFLTRVDGEYYWKPKPFSGLFIAPHANITRQPYYIYQGNYRLSERQSQFGGFGTDVGWSDGKFQELRAGWALENVDWTTTTGNDGMGNYSGNSQTARIRYAYDSQDRALVPRYGIRTITSLGLLYNTPGAPTTPQLTSQFEFARPVNHGPALLKDDVFLFNTEGGTMLNKSVPQPFRFTLGGPLRVSALAIDQLRGTDYWLVTPGYLHRLATLPAPLGQSIYFGATYEAGQMRAPDARTITRQDVLFGLVAETPFGVITVGPALGDGGQRKLIFTLGRFF